MLSMSCIYNCLIIWSVTNMQKTKKKKKKTRNQEGGHFFAPLYIVKFNLWTFELLLLCVYLFQHLWLLWLHFIMCNSLLLMCISFLSWVTLPRFSVIEQPGYTQHENKNWNWLESYSCQEFHSEFIVILDLQQFLLSGNQSFNVTLTYITG